MNGITKSRRLVHIPSLVAYIERVEELARNKHLAEIRAGYAYHHVSSQEDQSFEVPATLICACTALFQLGQLADPTPKQWNEVVAQAKGLSPGAIALRRTIMEGGPDAGADN